MSGSSGAGGTSEPPAATADGGTGGNPEDVSGEESSGEDAGTGCTGSDCAEATSCAVSAPGTFTCGENGDESCCESLLVPGGTYSRSYTNNGNGASGLNDPATISDFRLDKYELTVGRFRQFVNYLVEGGAPPAEGSGKHTHLNDGKGVADGRGGDRFEPGWNAAWNEYLPTTRDGWDDNMICNSFGTWTSEAGENETLPLTCMNWYESHAFCIWDGGFLPTEAEWKYASAGGDEQRRYPWGSAEPGRDSEYCIYDCLYPNKTPGQCPGLDSLPDVGYTKLGVGRWGHFDLSGSVWEWVLDIYAGYANPCVDCANFTGGSDRCMPGGGFHSGLMPYMLSGNRQSINWEPLNYRGDYGVGVRCARPPLGG